MKASLFSINKIFTMKIIITVFLLSILSACNFGNNSQVKKIKKIGIHTFSSEGSGDNAANWYYIRDINGHGENGYYLESQTPLVNFAHENFVYCDSTPEEFNSSYPLKEKLMLVNAKDLPANVQQSIADLESISVSE